MTDSDEDLMMPSTEEETSVHRIVNAHHDARAQQVDDMSRNAQAQRQQNQLQRQQQQQAIRRGATELVIDDSFVPGAVADPPAPPSTGPPSTGASTLTLDESDDDDLQVVSRTGSGVAATDDDLQVVSRTGSGVAATDDDDQHGGGAAAATTTITPAARARTQSASARVIEMMEDSFVFSPKTPAPAQLANEDGGGSTASTTTGRRPSIATDPRQQQLHDLAASGTPSTSLFAARSGVFGARTTAQPASATATPVSPPPPSASSSSSLNVAAAESPSSQQRQLPKTWSARKAAMAASSSSATNAGSVAGSGAAASSTSSNLVSPVAGAGGSSPLSSPAPRARFDTAGISVDFIIMEEEYRRLGVESRQNEARCHLATCFASFVQHLFQQQSRPKFEALQTPLVRWFRKWARAADGLLSRKLREANDFFDDQLQQISEAAAEAAAAHHNHDHHHHDGDHHHHHHDPHHDHGDHAQRSTSSGNYSATPRDPASLAASLEHTATRERTSSTPPHNGQQQSQFVNVTGLQKSVLTFARNFSPVNAPPSAGQVRAEGILQEIQQWGPADYTDMAYLLAPLVLVIGPRSCGKSSVIHCLTNKKPFFTSLPKVQPTAGIDAHVAHLRDVTTSVHATVPLATDAEEALGSLGNFSGASSSNSSRGSGAFFSESTLAHRVSRAVPTSQRDEQVQLKSSAHVRFLEVPPQLLATIPPRALPLSGFELLVCFDMTQDGTQARRELAAQFRQVASSVMTAVQERGEVNQPVIVAVYLVATNVDRMRSSERSAGALAGLLRDLRLWFKFVQEATVGCSHPSTAAAPGGGAASSNASSSATEDVSSAEQHQQTTTTSAFSYVHFYLVDAYAVSCSDWSVIGERPRSANNFAEMGADMFRTMAALRPLTPAHIGAQIVEQFVDALGSYEDATGTTIENLEGIRQSFGIRRDTACHVAPEVAVKQILDSRALNFSAPVRRVMIGVITFFTGIGRWADSCGYFIDYALFLRLVLQHVPVARLLEDVALVPPAAADPAHHDMMTRIFARCMQYAFVDVLSYHGIITVDKEEGFSSVLVGPHVFTRIINCFHTLEVVSAAAGQLNISERAALHFNEHKHSAEFPEIGKTDLDPGESPGGGGGGAAGAAGGVNNSSFGVGGTGLSPNDSVSAARLALSSSSASFPAAGGGGGGGGGPQLSRSQMLHNEVMRDLTAWQFGVVTPFAWRALLRGHLATLSLTDDDFFTWCSRMIVPHGFLEPHWTPQHIDFIASPTAQHAARSRAVEAGPILLSTMFAKHIHTRTQQFLVASLTTADDEQQPRGSMGTFAGCPVSASTTQSVLVQLLRSAATSDEFTMQDIAMWNDCLCFSTYWRRNPAAHHNNNHNNNNNHESSSPSSTNWDYCCMMMIYWDIDASSPNCRCYVSGISATGGGSPARAAGGGGAAAANNNDRDIVIPRGHPHHPHHHHHRQRGGDDDSEEEDDDHYVVDVSSAERALEWLKHDIERTVLLKNPIAELRPRLTFQDSRLGSATPVPFSGIAQTAREILAGCSRGAAESLLGHLQLLHERTWQEELPLRPILSTLMQEERVGPRYSQ